MNCKQSFLMVASIIGLSIQSSIPTQATPKPTIASNQSAQIVPANARSIAQKISMNEVERAVLLAKFTYTTPMIQQLDRRQIMLMGQLKQLQPDRYQTLAASATRSAVSAKIATLQAEYQQGDRAFTSAAPSQQILKSQIAALNQRLIEIPKN